MLKISFIYLPVCLFVYTMKDFIQEIQARQSDLTNLRESIGRLVPSQDSPELVEIGRLRRSWLELAKQAAELLEQREEDLQRSGDYQECLSTAEELFDQLSKEWDYLSRHVSEVLHNIDQCMSSYKVHFH